MMAWPVAVVASGRAAHDVVIAMPPLPLAGGEPAGGGVCATLSPAPPPQEAAARPAVAASSRRRLEGAVRASIGGGFGVKAGVLESR